MAVTYSVSSIAAFLRIGRNHRTAPSYSHRRIRSFLKYDLSSYGLDVGDIQSAQLKLTCSLITGEGDITTRLETGDGSDNWGSTLTASQADFESTCVYLEDEVDTFAIGEYYFDIDKTHLNLSGITYFRLRATDSESAYLSYADFRSQNHSTASERPKLVITLYPSEEVIEIDALSMTGTPQGISIQPDGVASIDADRLDLAATIKSCSIVTEGTAISLLDALSAEIEAQELSIIITGEAVTLADALEMAVIAQKTTFDMGMATTTLAALGLTSEGKAIVVVAEGTASIALDALTALLTAEDSAILIADSLQHPICLIVSFKREIDQAAGYDLLHALEASWNKRKAVSGGVSKCE